MGGGGRKRKRGKVSKEITNPQNDVHMVEVINPHEDVHMVDLEDNDPRVMPMEIEESERVGNQVDDVALMKKISGLTRRLENQIGLGHLGYHPREPRT